MQPKKVAHEVSCMAPQPPLPLELLEKDNGGEAVVTRREALRVDLRKLKNANK